MLKLLSIVGIAILKVLLLEKIELDWEKFLERLVSNRRSFCKRGAVMNKLLLQLQNIANFIYIY